MLTLSLGKLGVFRFKKRGMLTLSLGTSFGATAPPFLDYLRDILRRYPDGGQILKELIQNADDAQATEVVFIHDERSYKTESLRNDELGKYQGPALYTYNNAVFTDDDWERIQKAGRSGKINDPNKIGRFGIGFNSVYHVTDVPSIFSSGHLGLMDPQENIFGERNGGFLWSLDDPEHQQALTMQDQFQPYRDIVSLVGKREWSKVVEEDQYFDGTVFRFPLRNEKSEISDNLYDSSKVTELFDSFIADAGLSLLFLKNVTSVSLMRISADGVVHKRLEVKSSDPTGVTVKSEHESVIEGSTRFKQITLDSEVHRETKWLVTSCTMKEGKVKDLDVLTKKLSYFPRVDLAFPCGEERDCSKGRLSCFLPLPNNESNKTGLPVHVNACFGLTDNRRHIKWQEEDQKHDEHALWNELLVKMVLPQAYLKIIQDAIKLSQQSSLPVSSVYDLWPDITQMQHKDKWRNIALDVFDHLFRQNVAVLSLAKDERKFIPLSEAVLPCNGPTSPDIVSAIGRTLVSCGENLVTLSTSVARAIEANSHRTTPTRVTPTFLRRLLHRTGVQNIPRENKLCLLEYILSDGEYKELKGLQLLPLSDGTFRSFTDREEDTALIDSKEFPRGLLPCCKHLFIAQDLSATCKTHLKELARKNSFRVINLNKYHVAEYTRRYLPQDWKQTGTALVTWDSRNSQHPPSDWFHKFWKFLNTHFNDLSGFTDVPLIPVSPLSVDQPVSLAKLQPNTTLIFQMRKKKSLPDQIAQLVTKVGGTVVRGNDWIKHEDLDTYVLSPSPKSVMKVLKNLDSQCLIRNLKSESHKAREELKDYLSHQSSLSDTEKDLLLMLPLFQTMRGHSVAAQSKQAVLLRSDPTVPTELPMPDSVIQCLTEADRRLLKLLKVNLLGPAEAAMVLIDCIEKGTCSKEETEKIMTWILLHGNILFSQKQPLKQRCRNLSFIEVNGEMKKTSCFFDPRMKTFKVIFESDFFPPPVYTKTPQMLESLTDLGLNNKEADVSPEHVLRVATQIDKLHMNSHTEALKRAQALLEILDANDILSKFSREQLTHLLKLKWVPGTQTGNDKEQLSDKSVDVCFYCPDEMRHIMYEDIVGHVMPLAGKLSDRVSNKLGLKEPPPPEKVIDNLSVLKSTAKEMDDPDMNTGFKRSLHSIYRHMQENVSSFKAVMKETCWLWAHKQFVSPQDLVVDYPHDLDLSSYIWKVPNEFLPYKKLLQQFGLKKSLSSEEVVDILHSIQNKIQRRKQPFASPAEVKVSIEILNWLWREKKMVQNDIPVPVIIENGQFTLKSKSEALLYDVSKTGLKDLQFSQDNMYLLHEEIPKATAEWLNIQFLSNYILAPELVGIEQCGQSEPITMRIKNILKEYDEETDIFKELIQNAEDAGADQCKFMVDFRVHREKPESLIDPDMALCQGPCLWAFNNEQFSAEDWQNIVNVGSASKENKVEKIGKFGLGFNTVYHVTDVPSILSGNRLLILDPNVSHLKKHIKHKTNPGIKLDLSQKRLFYCFPGQFAPYECIFDCNFTSKTPPDPYEGTLIKLPFRREEEAGISEISTKVYHKHNILDLQQNFIGNAQSHLLFLKNIKTLSLQNIPDNGSTPPRDDEIKTILTVSRTLVNTIKIQDEACSKQHHAKKALMKLDGKCKEVIDSNTVNFVQITSQQHGEGEQQYWLLYNCFGTNESLKMSLQENKESRFSLPIGGISVPLKNNPESQKLSPPKDLVGLAFCFLPLPIQTGLPVNINGTFAVLSNRKGLWETGEKGVWNKALLKDPLVTAYVTALSALKEMSEKNQLENYCYHTFWPDRERVSDTFKPLVDAFYFAIAQHSNGPELLSDGEDWCTMNNAIFLHESIERDKDISTLVALVCKKYANASNCVVPLPLWLRNGFKQAGLEDVLKNRTWNWEKFYQEAVFKNLETMDHKTRDTLILHAIDLNIERIDNLLRSCPCIPTTSGQLQSIDKVVNPSGRVACLFEAEEGRLLGGTEDDFCSPRRIRRLLDLGMANDNLPLEEITKKAGTVNEVWRVNEEKAYMCLKCLLDLMRNHMDEQGSLLWETLRTTAFLPAFSAGDIKMERNKTLQMPTAVFRDEFALLVNMTQPVLDHSGLGIHNTDPLLQVLGISSSPAPNTVLQQLQEACKKLQSIDRSILHKIAIECYKCLDKWVSDGTDTTLISQMANSFPFILVGDTFVNVSCVAENGQFEAKPYLYILPRAFSSFRDLWETVSVKEEFSVKQFLTVLEELHSKHGNNPLPDSDLSTCLTILTKGIFEAKQKTDDCLIPNNHGVLQPARELVYNDSPWMPVRPDVTLCHANISRVMAQQLGIKTTRHHSLENYKEDISPFAFEFGQHEELAVRIKGIISAYPSKKDILKELIQNADDAEATEIHFVWDKRHHSKEKTFGKRWNPLQGPALCVFNNKVFSKDDLTGIQQLGEGGKQNSPGKIGKYGVGFNSVYHLTDCPSILTGDKLLCISDPNKKYIDCHSDKRPFGIGYKLPDTFKEMYMDVYNSFLPDKFSLKDGTMFRLPLRTSANGQQSKISQQEVTDVDMEELCSALSEDPEGLMLFLKNICKIKIHEINEHSGKLKTIFQVEKSLPEGSGEVNYAFTKHLQYAFNSERLITPEKAFYETTISTSDKRQSTWIIAEQFGSFKDSDVIKLSNKLPQGAIAACMSKKGSDSSQASKMAFKGAVFCSLPLPGETGLPVHISGNFEVDAGRKNMWKEDGEGHRSNWNEFLKQNIIAPLYADLLHYIRGKITVKTVSLGDTDSCFNTSYLCFWPTVSKNVSPEWHEMIHEVYRSMKEKGLDVIPVLRSSMRKFLHHEIRENTFEWCNLSETETTKLPYLTQSAFHNINPILEDLGMKLVPTSTNMQKIWSIIKAAGINVKKVSPATVRTFLSVKSVNDPTQTDEDLPLPITETLIRDKTRHSELLEYCFSNFSLENDIKQNPSLLNGLPLLLTRDAILRTFDSESPKLISRYDNLFDGFEDKFADYETFRHHIILLQTCNLIKNLTLFDSAELLKPLVQSHTQNCEDDPHSGLYILDETMRMWLESLWKFILSEMKFKISPDDDQTLTFKEVKKLLGDFCILPVVGPNNKHFLQTMKNMSSVIPHESNKEIPEILIKLGFMRHDGAFFTKIDRQVYLLLRAELMDVNDKNSVLDQICNINRSEFSHLSDDDMKTLQNFLQSGVSSSKDNHEYQRKLKSLPLFETMHGQRVRIDGPTEVFVLNKCYSERFPDLFTLPNINCIFLKYNFENQILAQLLKITILDGLEYFVRFILPIVHTLAEKQTFHCLKLLLLLHYYLNFGQFKDKIISSMKTVKLIRSSQGRLETASYYFDDGVELYRRMAPQERFVPEKFWMELCKGEEYTKDQAKKLIRELGMKHEVSKDDIIDFAYKLESEAKGNGKLEELKQKATLLLRVALNKASNDKDKKLLQSIADIRFIFPEKIRGELCNYHQPFAAKRDAVEIRGSLISRDQKHQDLIWSSMPIIHLPFITAEVLKMLKDVGAHEQPPTHCVTSNTRNICTSPCKTEQLVKTRADVFRRSYAYLQAKGFDGQSLAGLPLVLVEEDTQLLKPENVCLSLHYDLEFRPYLYQIPPKDAIYAEFFKKIGVEEAATAVQYCNVLADVHADSCDKPEMNPNQLITVKRAVEQLFLLIKNQGNQVLTDDVQTLYLPAVDGKLHLSCSLYYNDTVFETKRVEEALENKFLLLEKLSNCHLDSDIFEQHRLVQLLPKKFQPQMLSAITQENMVESQRCELGTSCDFSGWFDKHLSSQAFRHGLICLLREQSQGKTTQEEAAKMCEKTFGSIHIVCCETLKTMLCLDGEPLHKTTRDTHVFVKREQHGCTFYLQHNEDMAPKVINKVNMTLIKEINALLGHQISSVHLLVLGQLLMCDNLEDVLKTLAENEIRDSAENECLILNPPAPGTDVPDEWCDSLDMNFLNNFEEGEYVGYSTENKYIYAIVVEELRGSCGRQSRRYKIDIGEDELVEVGHLDLYQFKREKKLKQEETTCKVSMELKLLAGSVPHSSKPSKSSLPTSLDEAKKEIDRCLSEIWCLPEEERQKGIKRLYLRWHPDKNPDCKSLATEAFKYLMNRIDELSKGRSVGSPHSSHSSRYSDFSDFFHQWNQEARYHRSSRERFSGGHRSYNFWSYNTNVPRPNKEEAQRWYKQARCDLDAAQKDTDGGSTEWCLFKVHQAVEKALIAAEYKRNGQRPTNCSISAIAEKVSQYHPLLRDLPQIVEHLKSLGVDAKKTQYPNYHPNPRIPNEQFRLEKGELALRKASELLSKVESFVN